MYVIFVGSLGKRTTHTKKFEIVKTVDVAYFMHNTVRAS